MYKSATFKFKNHFETDLNIQIGSSREKDLEPFCKGQIVELWGEILSIWTSKPVWKRFQKYSVKVA